MAIAFKAAYIKKHVEVYAPCLDATVLDTVPIFRNYTCDANGTLLFCLPDMRNNFKTLRELFEHITDDFDERCLLTLSREQIQELNIDLLFISTITHVKLDNPSSIGADGDIA